MNTIFYVAGAIALVFFVIIGAKYGKVYLRRQKSLNNAHRRADELNNPLEPMYYLFTAPFRLVNKKNQDITVINEEYDIYEAPLHVSSCIPDAGFQVVIDVSGRIINPDEVKDFPDGRLQFTLIPADNVSSAWKVWDILGSDIRLTHPVMGVVRIKKPARSIRIGDKMMLKQTAKKVDKSYLLNFEIC